MSKLTELSWGEPNLDLSYTHIYLWYMTMANKYPYPGVGVSVWMSVCVQVSVFIEVFDIGLETQSERKLRHNSLWSAPHSHLLTHTYSYTHMATQTQHKPWRANVDVVYW